MNGPKIPLIVQAVRRIKSIIPPLKIEVTYRGETEATITIVGYETRNGRLRVCRSPKENGQNWVIQAEGEFVQYLRTVKKNLSKL